MKLEFKTSELDAEGYPETVIVDGKPVGTFFTTEEGWGCLYKDKLLTESDYAKDLDGRPVGQVLDFGEMDYDKAKKQLAKILKAMN